MTTRCGKLYLVLGLLMTCWGCQPNPQHGANASAPPTSGFGEGTAIQDSSNDRVYFIAHDKRHYIKFPTTLRALGLDNGVKVEPDSVVSSIPLGDDMPIITSRIIQDSTTGRVYVLESGKRRYVPDAVTLRRLHLADQVQGLSGPDASSIPLGTPLPPSEGE